MHKVIAPGATALNEFTEGNPATGAPATTVPATWMNTVQRELVAAVDASGQTLDPNDDAQLLAAIQILGGGGGGGGGGASKNLLINGDFALQQRVLAVGNFAVTNAGRYTADRWYARADAQGSGSGAATISRQPFAVGQVLVPNEPGYFLRWVQAPASTINNPALAQRVEDVRRFQSGPLTFSCYLKASAALAGSLRMLQKFGTGGSPSADVIVATQSVSLSTAWQRFTCSVNLTTAGFTMAGKTLGTNLDDHLLCEILLPNGSTYTLEIADAQLERNAQASAFGRRGPGEELALARRYFQRTGTLAVPLDTASQVGAMVDVATNSGSLTIYSFGRPFPVAMRKTPAMTWRNPADGVINTVNWAGARAVSSSTGASELFSGAPVCAAGPGVGTPSLCNGHYEADAEI